SRLVGVVFGLVVGRRLGRLVVGLGGFGLVDVVGLVRLLGLDLVARFDLVGALDLGALDLGALDLGVLGLVDDVVAVLVVVVVILAVVIVVVVVLRLAGGLTLGLALAGLHPAATAGPLRRGVGGFALTATVELLVLVARHHDGDVARALADARAAAARTR